MKVKHLRAEVLIWPEMSIYNLLTTAEIERAWFVEVFIPPACKKDTQISWLYN